jgi:hypothetical protein
VETGADTSVAVEEERMLLGGDGTKLVDERLERLGREGATPPACTQRSELIDSLFCKEGTDDILSSLKELELGVLRREPGR